MYLLLVGESRHISAAKWHWLGESASLSKLSMMLTNSLDRGCIAICAGFDARKTDDKVAEQSGHLTFESIQDLNPSV